jgi:hypothetical protein
MHAGSNESAGSLRTVGSPQGARAAGAAPSAQRATVTRRVFHGHDWLIGLRLADRWEALWRALDGTTPVRVGDRCAVGCAVPYPWPLWLTLLGQEGGPPSVTR